LCTGFGCEWEEETSRDVGVVGTIWVYGLIVDLPPFSGEWRHGIVAPSSGMAQHPPRQDGFSVVGKIQSSPQSDLVLGLLENRFISIIPRDDLDPLQLPNQRDDIIIQPDETLIHTLHCSDRGEDLRSAGQSHDCIEMHERSMTWLRIFHRPYAKGFRIVELAFESCERGFEVERREVSPDLSLASKATPGISPFSHAVVNL